MKIKMNVIIAIMITFCFSASIFLAIPTQSQTTKTYNPLADINEDGKVSLADLVLLAQAYGTNGTPVNITDVQNQITDLQSRVTSLEAQANSVKTIRFYTPNETMNNDQQNFKDAAVFVWNPHNTTNNAILSIRCYFQYHCESQGLQFNIVVNNLGSDSSGWLVSSAYTWSHIYTEAQLFYFNQNLFPNQGNYTIEFRFGVQNSAFPAYVKDINIVMEVTDGMPPS